MYRAEPEKIGFSNEAIPASSGGVSGLDLSITPQAVGNTSKEIHHQFGSVPRRDLLGSIEIAKGEGVAWFFDFGVDVAGFTCHLAGLCMVDLG